MGRILPIVVLCCISLNFTSAFEHIKGDSKGEGESCTEGRMEATCTFLAQCHVYTEGGEWWKLKICGFIGHHSVICCPDKLPTTTTSTSTTTTSTTTTPRPTSTISSTSTTEYAPPAYNYPDNNVGPDGCERVPGETTGPTGIKSWDKCREYQTQLVYPCEEPAIPIEGKPCVRLNNCHHFDTDLLMHVDTFAHYGEFPHMVLLGYDQTNGTAVWQCGGTLISDRFILTAAYCTRSKILGYVKYVLVGAHKRTDDVKPWQVHRIKRIIRHPDFYPRTMENNIALLEVNPITLNNLTVPACLDVFGGDRNHAVATGWGATSTSDKPSDTLKKETLTKFTDRECRDHYPPTINKPFNSTTQTCYGDYTKSPHICQGDGGGPLTILNPRLHCMYTVVGIISFGKKCGVPGKPDVYTKVSHYVPWIESIVWP